jgi:hypothetical protein
MTVREPPADPVVRTVGRQPRHVAASGGAGPTRPGNWLAPGHRRAALIGAAMIAIPGARDPGTPGRRRSGYRLAVAGWPGSRRPITAPLGPARRAVRRRPAGAHRPAVRPGTSIRCPVRHCGHHRVRHSCRVGILRSPTIGLALWLSTGMVVIMFIVGTLARLAPHQPTPPVTASRSRRDRA